MQKRRKTRKRRWYIHPIIIQNYRHGCSLTISIILSSSSTVATFLRAIFGVFLCVENPPHYNFLISFPWISIAAYGHGHTARTATWSDQNCRPRIRMQVNSPLIMIGSDFHRIRSRTHIRVLINVA